MGHRTIEEQLTKYLTDVHSIEVQALEQMKVAPRLAGGGRLAVAFHAHRDETRAHERLVRAELGRRGADTSALKDLAGRVGGWAMVAFARLNPDTPGKLTAHAFSYEHMELAAYELLGRMAQRADDRTLAALAKAIGDQERAMAERLADCFDAAVDASLHRAGRADIASALVSYLTDARAIEAQAIVLLESGSRIASVPALTDVLRNHLDETRGHKRLLEDRLRAHDARALALPEHRPWRRRRQPRRVLRRAARHAGQGRGVRLRVRTPRDRGLRAAASRRRPCRRRGDRRRRRADPRRGAPRRRPGCPDVGWRSGRRAGEPRRRSRSLTWGWDPAPVDEHRPALGRSAGSPRAYPVHVLLPGHRSLQRNRRGYRAAARRRRS